MALWKLCTTEENQQMVPLYLILVIKSHAIINSRYQIYVSFASRTGLSLYKKSYLVNAKFKIIMSLISAKGMDIHERYTVQEEKAPKLQINNSKIDRLHLLKVLIKVVLGDLGAVEAIDLALDIGIGPFVRYGTLAFTESSELTVTLLLGSTISQV